MRPTSTSWSTALDLKNAIHVGHSTGGGEVTRYVARHEQGPRRQGRADRRGAAGHGQEGVRIRAARRSRCSTAFARRWPPTAPSSTSISRPGPSTASTGPARRCREGLIRNWWRQGMMGSIKAGYECIKAFSETDFTEDLKAIDVPVLVIHSEDDQIVPYADSGAADGQAAEKWHAQDLQGPAARLCHDPSGHHQCGPSRLHPRRNASNGRGRLWRCTWMNLRPHSVTAACWRLGPPGLHTA